MEFIPLGIGPAGLDSPIRLGCRAQKFAQRKQQLRTGDDDLLARLEALADPASAHLAQESIHHRRHASVGVVDGECIVRASGGVAQGLVISEVFERFMYSTKPLTPPAKAKSSSLPWR